MKYDLYHDYKKRIIDPVSDSFCAAKWLNATIWLGSGKTTSCHHPPAQDIDPNEILLNPSAIHNTKHKKEMRKQMLEGSRPSECEYCWKIEDIGRDNISDRVFKTIIYSDEKIQEISKAPWDSDVNLESLEIAFDRTCNLACSYCNASFSTGWSQDIQKNGPFKGLLTHGGETFTNDGAATHVTLNGQQNVYVKAFWDWWPMLAQSLKELRITGGEPLLSDHVWFLMDKFREEKLDIRLVINSNLSMKEVLIDALIEKSKSVKSLALYTSCEAYGEQAEYIRDGLNFRQYLRNCEKVLELGNLEEFSVMMTVNALCLFSMTDFMDIVLKWKEKYNTNITISLNILRFPSFMSVASLPDHIKLDRMNAIKKWRDQNVDHPQLSGWELASIDRLIDYLDVVKTPHSSTSKQEIDWSDFRVFFQQYDKRRNKNLKKVFPKLLTDWVDCIRILKSK